MFNRREFLVGLGAAAATGYALAAAPAVVEAKQDGFLNHGLLIDPKSKTIFISDDHPRMTVFELYRELREQWAFDVHLADIEQPMFAVTQNLIEMENDWRVDSDSIREKLHNGSLTQGDEYWMGVSHIGRSPDKTGGSFVIQDGCSTAVRRESELFLVNPTRNVEICQFDRGGNRQHTTILRAVNLRSIERGLVHIPVFPEYKL